MSHSIRHAQKTFMSSKIDLKSRTLFSACSENAPVKEDWRQVSNYLYFICIPTDWNFPIFENSTSFSRTKRKERKDVLNLWEISWPQNISLEILQRTACVSLSCVSLSTVFIVINEPCVYLWVCLSEDNIQMREVHVNNYNYEDELEFFIQLLNKTALQEIGARDNVTIENPPLDSPTEEEVANDVVRVDVRHSQ